MKETQFQIKNSLIDFPLNVTARMVNLNELIKQMLQVDPRDRFSIEEVLKHFWFEETRSTFTFPDFKTRIQDKSSRIKVDLTMFLNDLGFPQDFVIEKLNSESEGHIHACYEALLYSN